MIETIKNMFRTLFGKGIKGPSRELMRQIVADNEKESLERKNKALAEEMGYLRERADYWQSRYRDQDGTSKGLLDQVHSLIRTCRQLATHLADALSENKDLKARLALAEAAHARAVELSTERFLELSALTTEIRQLREENSVLLDEIEELSLPPVPPL